MTQAQIQTLQDEIENLKEQIARQEEAHQALITRFDDMPIGWGEHRMVFDEQGRAEDYIFLEVNKAFESYTGLGREAILDKPVTQVIPGIENADPNLIQIYGDVVKSGESTSIEIYFEPFEQWYKLSAFRSREDCFMVIFENITEAKKTGTQLAQEEAKVKYFLDNTEDLVTVVNPDGNFVYVNKAAQKVYGVTPDELMGQSAFAFIHPEDQEKTQVSFTNWIRSKVESASFENRQVAKDETTRTMLWTIMPKYKNGGDLDSVWSIARDISERKASENELNRQKSDLERSNRELQQFAYVASHDLQEPLRMVSSYLQLIEKRYKDKLDEAGIEFIAYAVDGAKRMKVMINDLLAFSRVGTQGKELTCVYSEKAAQQAVENLGLRIEETGAQVEIAPLPAVMADQSQLTQLFQNLLENAIKFNGDEAAQIRIEATQAAEETTFVVSDKGIGIDPQFAERIFVIFQRLHPIGHYSGSGIGLAICKKIVERHGGRIWFKSEPGEGTKFFFTLTNGEKTK